MITHDIAKFIHHLRRMPEIDVERLSYELSEHEWLRFIDELSVHQYMTGMQDMSYVDKCLFMGITIRKRDSDNTGDGQ